MKLIGQIAAAIHNFWIGLPTWARTGIDAIVVALVTTALAFGWTLPTNWTGAVAEIHAYWLVVFPLLVRLFQSDLLPGIVRWFLGMFNLAIVPTLAADAAPYQPLRSGAWFIWKTA